LREGITAVILTKNEERRIENCLKHLNWVDEIIIIDSYSTDKTLEICRRFTDNIYQREWPQSFSDQRNYGDSLASNKWIFSIDADEIVPDELKKEIINRFKKMDESVCGFNIRRKEFMFGKWIMYGGWSEQYKTRIYRKDKGEWVGKIHEKFIVDGEVENLSNYLLHYSYESIPIFIEKFNNYSTIEADSAFKEGKRFSWFKLFFAPIERFLGRFIIHKGFRDGTHGFVVALLIALNYFLRYLKLWELYYKRDRKF
jgi:glycosyltransferase involved in cell wall biosynthesis